MSFLAAEGSVARRGSEQMGLACMPRREGGEPGGQLPSLLSLCGACDQVQVDSDCGLLSHSLSRGSASCEFRALKEATLTPTLPLLARS